MLKELLLHVFPVIARPVRQVHVIGSRFHEERQRLVLVQQALAHRIEMGQVHGLAAQRVLRSGGSSDLLQSKSSPQAIPVLWHAAQFYSAISRGLVAVEIFSAMRSLGAYHNVFSIESFMDELAVAAGADPVEFRLKHLDDSRGRDVIDKAAQGFGWQSGQKAPRDRGFGFAFARYKNLAAYCAVATEVEVNRETGRTRLVRAVAAVDSGQVVNPDGLINQIEGAILQSMSWTLYESVTFDDTRITSIDWQTYPILRFNSVPDSIAVHIINRPGQPFLGSGETGQGPAAASIANAVASATGKRLRDLPLTRKRIKDAIGAGLARPNTRFSRRRP